MDAAWDEITRMVVPPSGPHLLPTPASTIAFDDTQELLWIGNDHVSFSFRPQSPKLTHLRVE
jgi:PAB-dependent poly(A)-specific ribonuclease subunit 2